MSSAITPPGPRVILVDGDSAVRNAVSFSLELDGFAVDVYASAEAARSADMPRQGCLVLEYNLPGMDGLQLLSRLRARSVTLPALLTATNPDKRLRRRALAAGVGIVEKPILGEALVEGVRSALHLPDVVR